MLVVGGGGCGSGGGGSGGGGSGGGGRGSGGSGGGGGGGGQVHGVGFKRSGVQQLTGCCTPVLTCFLVFAFFAIFPIF